MEKSFVCLFACLFLVGIPETLMYFSPSFSRRVEWGPLDVQQCGPLTLNNTNHYVSLIFGNYFTIKFISTICLS